MSAEPVPDRPVDLDKLAEEVEIAAEVTADSGGKRALRFVALGYARLAQFARTKTNTSDSDIPEGQDPSSAPLEDT